MSILPTTLTASLDKELVVFFSSPLHTNSLSKDSFRVYSRQKTGQVVGDKNNKLETYEPLT